MERSVRGTGLWATSHWVAALSAAHWRGGGKGVYGFIDVNDADAGGSVSEAMHAVSRRRI